jgi:transposase-like protein
MNSRKQWSAEDKFKIVMEGVGKEVPLGELCARHGIRQSLYYRWREQLLAEGKKVFERGGVSGAEERLKAENRRLKAMIGELTMELKKSDF